MKKIKRFIQNLIDIIYQRTYADIRVLKLRPAGMFSNVNEVIQHLYLASDKSYRFVIDWSRSCYRSDEHDGDPWNYYFEPCFKLRPPLKYVSKVLQSGPAVTCSATNIITPRSVDESNDSILEFPQIRELVKQIIDKHIHIKKDIIDEVNTFTDRHFSTYTIGMHIRGQGALDAQRSETRMTQEGKIQIPYQEYFSEAHRVLKKRPESKILVCSDSSAVVDHVLSEFGEKVITFDAVRTIKGEMHALKNKIDDSNQPIDAYTLGKDVLVEALLLAKTNYFISGRSNVVNFVLCKNPNLEHYYAEQDIDKS